LHYGFCHTVILDKNSRFYGVCCVALDLLQINRHIISGNNHNQMIVERVNQYLTKGLKKMTNEHHSVYIALKAILLSFYMRGTPAQFLVQIFLASLSPLVVNLPFQSITQQTSIRN
jgi:hypothetical protein